MSRELTFARSDVVQVQLVSLLGSLQGALGGEEVARGLVGLVVGAANLQNKPKKEKKQREEDRQMRSLGFKFFRIVRDT